MSVGNKKLLTDILKVVKKIYKLMKKENNISPKPSRKKRSRKKKIGGRKKKKFDQKKLTQLIKKISKDPSYMSLGARQLSQKIHDENPEFPLDAIHSELQKIPQIQIYKNVNKRQEKRHYRHITAPRPFWSVQVDIMDLDEYHSSHPNHSSYRYICLFVDVFSRYMIAKPMKTKEMDEQAENIEEAINEIREKASHTEDMPKNLVSDQEFNNEDVNGLCEHYEVAQQFSTDLTKGYKTQIIERGVRTLRTMIETWVDTMDDFKWETHIDEIIKTYNTRHHRSIGTDPNYAVQKSIIYPPKRLQRNFESVVLDVGSHVRIKEKKGIFEKGHLAKWSREVYTITRYDEDQAKYELRDEEGEILEELYPRRLLQPVEMLEQSSDTENEPPPSDEESSFDSNLAPIPENETPPLFFNDLPNIPQSDEEKEKEPSPPKIGDPKIPQTGEGAMEVAMKNSLLVDSPSFDEDELDSDNATVSGGQTPSSEQNSPSIEILHNDEDSNEFQEFDPNEARNSALAQMYAILPEDAWVNVDVTGDGNCLFNSLIGELHYTPQDIIPTNLNKNEKKQWKKMALKLRAECVNWLIQNRKRKPKGLQGVSVEDTIYVETYNDIKRERYLNEGRTQEKKDRAFEKYTRNMRADGTWGGWLEIVACAYLKNVDIVVYIYDEEDPLYRSSSTIMTTENMSNVVRLYHNMEFDYVGSHYQYLVPVEMIHEDNMSPEKRKLKLKKGKKLGKIAKKLSSHQRQVIKVRDDVMRPEIKKGKPTGKKLLARRSLRLQRKQKNKDRRKKWQNSEN